MIMKVSQICLYRDIFEIGGGKGGREEEQILFNTDYFQTEAFFLTRIFYGVDYLSYLGNFIQPVIIYGVTIRNERSVFVPISQCDAAHAKQGSCFLEWNIFVRFIFSVKVIHSKFFYITTRNKRLNIFSIAHPVLTEGPKFKLIILYSVFSTKLIWSCQDEPIWTLVIV